MLPGIKWNRRAVYQFDVFVRHIQRDSPGRATMVRKSVLMKINTLQRHPEMFPPDKFKISNDGNYRAFEICKCRVSYYVTPTQIRILRIRHTARNPRWY